MVAQENSQDFILKVKRVLSELGQLLAVKNKAYGNSALQPIHIFFKDDLPVDTMICKRIDEKLTRIQNADTLRKNDVVDVMGYLTLLCIQEGWFDFTDLYD